MPNGGGFGDMLSQSVYPHLKASGSWGGDQSISKHNQVHIDCELERKLCTMMLAQVRNDKSAPYLTLDANSFAIKVVDSDSLRAVDETGDSCLRTTLLIDRT